MIIAHWSGITVETKLKDGFQKFHNKAVRIITKDNYEKPTFSTLFKLGWKTLQSCRNIQTLSLVKKCVGNESDLPNPKFLFTISNRDCHDLRSNNHMLSLPKPNTNAMKTSFGYRGAMISNGLPLGEKIQCF